MLSVSEKRREQWNIEGKNGKISIQKAWSQQNANVLHSCYSPSGNLVRERLFRPDNEMLSEARKFVH